MMFVFLLLLSSVFAQQECIKSWYYFENATPEQEQRALNDGCFHGTYGTISLLACHYEDSKFLSNQDCSALLCVVETSSTENLLEKITAKNTEVNRKDTEFLIRVGVGHVLSSVDGTYSCLNMGINPGEATIITVSDEPWRPMRRPLSANLTSGVPDPAIQAAIATVKAETIFGYIESLANDYNSRQSQSQGAWDAQYFLETTFRSFGFTVTRHTFRDDMSDVVVAEIVGDIPSQIVIVGAHYDSRGTNSGSTTQRAPGADDNASGTATLLALAKLIFDEQFSFRYTIRLCCFSGEEQGLLGSRSYARMIANRGPNGDPVIAMLNGDMLGWKQTTQPITLGMMNRYVDPALTTEMNGITKDYVPELPVGTTGGCCSDQQSFQEVGYPSVGYFENTANSVVYPYYHQSTDLPQYINQEQLGLEGKALMAGALHKAGAYKEM
jgi:hypothetical protein